MEKGYDTFFMYKQTYWGFDFSMDEATVDERCVILCREPYYYLLVICIRIINCQKKLLALLNSAWLQTSDVGSDAPIQ